MNIYLLINLLTIAGPLAWSFESRIQYYKRWPSLLPAILLTAAAFIIWDVKFTQMGIWGFNPEYSGGIKLLGLPLGEWLFFITVPYASMFIYENVKYFLAGKLPRNLSLYGSIGLLTLMVFLFRNPTGWYTLVNLSLAFYWIVLMQFFFRPPWLNLFFMAYFIHLIPFLIVNGILTALPIVYYNDLENCGLRISTIPMEDIYYSFSLLIMNVFLYEFFQNRRLKKSK